MVMSMNEWTYTGKVFYMREITGVYSASVKMTGESKRADGLYKSDPLQFGCIMRSNVFEEAKRKGLKIGKTVTFSGHLEIWDKTIHGKPANKVMFISDYVLEVS